MGVGLIFQLIVGITPWLKSMAGEPMSAKDNSGMLDPPVRIQELCPHSSHPRQLTIADQLIKPLGVHHQRIIIEQYEVLSPRPFDSKVHHRSKVEDTRVLEG